MDKDLYHPYINGNGKRVCGPAALNHYIYTVKGSLQNYHDEIGEGYLRDFVKAHSDIINEGFAQKARRERFRIAR